MSRMHNVLIICGCQRGEPYITWKSDAPQSFPKSLFAVECDACGERSGWFDTIDEAVKDWNKKYA